MSIFGKPLLTGVGKGLASGAVASFSDGAKGLPLRSLLVNIEPVQAGTGDSSPDNMRPITGWTGTNLQIAGKNLIKGPFPEYTNYYGTAWQNNADGSVSVTGTPTESAYCLVSISLPAGTYIVSGAPNDSANSHNDILIQDINKVTIARDYKDATANVRTFTLDAPSQIRVLLRGGANHPTNCTFYPMIQLASNAGSIYTPYSGTTIPITWQSEAGTVYDGTLDVLTGKLTVTMASVAITEASSVYLQASLPIWICTKNIGSNVKQNSSVIGDIIGPRAWRPGHFWTAATPYIGIIPFDTSMTTLNQANTWLQEHPVQAVYELATPITYQLTPQQISTLQGQNNVWADTGDITVEYLKQSLMHIGSTIRTPHYGAVWDTTHAYMVRTGDAANITTNTTNFKHSGSVNPNYDNPFDSIYPWSGRKLCNISLALYQVLQPGDNIKDCVTYWETDDGFSYNDPDGVWVYTPEFWGTSYWSDGKRYFDVSPVELAGYHHYEEQITARWRGISETRTIAGNNKTILLSKPGMPTKRVAVSTIHTYAKNGGMTLDSIYSIDASNLLYLIEYANYNAKRAIGYGASDLYCASVHPDAAVTEGTTVQFTGLTNEQLSYFIPNAIIDFGTNNGSSNIKSTYITEVVVNGNITTVTLADAVTITTDTFVSIHGRINVQDAEIGSMSGYIGTNSKADAYYRGEALWGNIFYYVLGAYKSNTRHVWLDTNGTEDNYDELNPSVHTDTGIILSNTNGFIKVLEWPDELKMLSACALCTEVGGSSSNPVGDYFYTSNLVSSQVLLVGGGDYEGPFTWWWASDASDSAWCYAGRPRLKSP